jgi:putative transcriptional regulator
LGVRSSGPSSLGLAGSLLIAHPALLDPNFRKSVLLVPIHDPEEGSFGFVLNRPTGRVVADFLPDEDLGVLADLPVYVGGPVSADQLTFAALRWDAEGERITCQTHLSIEEVLQVAGEEEVSVRAFLGYAGWSGGQLEAELAQPSWLVQRPGRELLDPARCEALWGAIMREQEPWLRLIASAPDDPSAN